MFRFTAKISTALLAPVVLGAGCFVCIFRAAPVHAASAPMAKACAEYKTDAQVSGVSVAPMASDAMMQIAGHDLGCQTKNDSAAFEIKPLSFSPCLNGQTASLSILDINDLYPKDRFFEPQRKRPEKIDLITGCVFKLE
jgi:hypothetical protein